MIRAFFRMLTFACLALFAVLAVIDATRTIGGSALLLTSLGASWTLIAPESYAALERWSSAGANAETTSAILATVMQWPTLAVLAGLCMVFAWLGQPRRRRRRRIAPR